MSSPQDRVIGDAAPPSHLPDPPPAEMGDAWADMSPHHSGFVTLNGVKLHYLDWGGQGENLIFLHGNGHTAHIFDDLAPRFIDCFRVLALTRRGHGESDRPDTGYDTDTLVEDIRQFLDQKGIRRAILTGHSFAGDELTRFAGLYPERVSRLIYLDAAYDSSDLPAILANHPVSFAPSDSDLRSFDTLRHYLQTLRSFGTEESSWSSAEEANMRASWTTGADGTVHYLLPRPVLEALWNGTIEAHPDYTQLILQRRD
jgi:non-heme chloroperoxidase